MKNFNKLILVLFVGLFTTGIMKSSNDCPIERAVATSYSKDICESLTKYGFNYHRGDSIKTKSELLEMASINMQANPEKSFKCLSLCMQNLTKLSTIKSLSNSVYNSMLVEGFFAESNIRKIQLLIDLESIYKKALADNDVCHLVVFSLFK